MTNKIDSQLNNLLEKIPNQPYNSIDLLNVYFNIIFIKIKFIRFSL